MASKKYLMVKQFYIDGYWTKDMVKMAVVKNWITAEEYKLITGEDYMITT